MKTFRNLVFKQKMNSASLQLSTASQVVSIILLSSLPYWFSLDGEFVFDDSEAIVNNEDVSGEGPIWNAFRNDFWGSPINSTYSHKSYRPLTILSFRLNRHLGSKSGDRTNPYYFKLINLLCHALCGLLYLAFCKIILHRKSINARRNAGTGIGQCFDLSYFAATLFAVHPVHTEAVSGIVGRADLLAASFYFMAFIFYHSSTRRGSEDDEACFGGQVLVTLYKWLWFLVSMVCAGASMLFKETGITVLGLCLVYDVIIVNGWEPWNIKMWSRNTPSELVKKQLNRNVDGMLNINFLMRISLVILFAAMLLLWRVQVMGGVTPTFDYIDNPTAFSDSLWTKVWSYSYVHALNMILMIWPQWLCFDWSMGCVPLVQSVVDPRLMAPVVLYVYALACVYVVLNSLVNGCYRRRLMMSICCLLIPFVPASNAFFTVGFVVAERVLYLPSAGYCMIVVLGLDKLVRYRCGKYAKILMTMYALLVLTFVLRTHQRAQQWRSEYDLFLSGLDVCPLNAKVHYNVAKVVTEKGDFRRVEREYREAIRLHPGYYQAMNNLGNLLKDRQRYSEAVTYLRRAVELKRDFPAAWMNLGIVLAHLNSWEESEKSYMEALKYRKKYPDCHYNLGNLYLDMERYEAAVQTWIIATELNPEHNFAWSNLLAVLDNTGQLERALSLAAKALSHLPDSASIHFNVGNLLGKNGDFESAERHFLKAVRLKGDRVPAIYYTNIGVLYHRWNQLDRARSMYEKSLRIDPNSRSARDNLRKLSGS